MSRAIQKEAVRDGDLKLYANKKTKGISLGYL